MKKILILLAVAMTITLTSCAGISILNSDNINIDKAYKFSADMQFGNDFNAVAQFERQNAGIWTVTLTEPFALSGVVMTYDSGDITAQFEGLNSAVGGGGNAVVRHVIGAFENAIGGEGRNIVSSGEEIRITSKTEDSANSYELVLDKNTLAPKRLTMPDVSLAVEFSEVQMSQIVQVILPNEQQSEIQTSNDTTEEDTSMQIIPVD